MLDGHLGGGKLGGRGGVPRPLRNPYVRDYWSLPSVFLPPVLRYEPFFPVLPRLVGYYSSSEGPDMVGLPPQAPSSPFGHGGGYPLPDNPRDLFRARWMGTELSVP